MHLLDVRLIGSEILALPIVRTFERLIADRAHGQQVMNSAIVETLVYMS